MHFVWTLCSFEAEYIFHHHYILHANPLIVLTQEATSWNRNLRYENINISIREYTLTLSSWTVILFSSSRAILDWMCRIYISFLSFVNNKCWCSGIGCTGNRFPFFPTCWKSPTCFLFSSPVPKWSRVLLTLRKDITYRLFYEGRRAAADFHQE